MENKTIAKFVSKLLQTRYKLSIKGRELLESDQSSLYLPNHQAEVDPQILLAEIAKLDDAVPMISDAYYKLPLVKPFMERIGAVPVADFDAGNRDPNVLVNMRNAMLKALRQGKSILLYPSGQLCQQGYEKVQNKQSAYKLILELDDNIRVIGVRQHGLWGSIWSRAWWGKSPNFFKVFLRSLFYVLANLIFFVPKRSVEIEFVDITKEAKAMAQSSTRQEFNKYMEDFFNVRGEEEVRFIKHYFFAPKLKHKLPKRIKGVINKERELRFRPLPEPKI
jgi:long-chain-fatty-acid--[acyl-carrier-protein] ligase